MSNDEREKLLEKEIIETYFYSGHSYTFWIICLNLMVEICHFPLLSLKRRLQMRNMQRSQEIIDIDHIKEVICKEKWKAQVVYLDISLSGIH